MLKMQCLLNNTAKKVLLKKKSECDNSDSLYLNLVCGVSEQVLQKRIRSAGTCLLSPYDICRKISVLVSVSDELHCILYSDCITL